jgi:hypothetical protein
MAATALAAMSVCVRADDRDTVAQRVMLLTRDSRWRLVGTTPMQFRTFHPQGMVKIGDVFFISSVELQVAPTRFSQPVDGHDRNAGQGVGHLFKVDRSGRLIADLTLSDGSMYHPGGIDFDGQFIWVPVAEYRPDSRAVIYKVDPVTLKALEVFRYPDHIGAIVYDSESRTLHGVSWGSRRFYRWTLDPAGRVIDADTPPRALAVANPSHYIDYQDCKFAGAGRMLCAGLAELHAPNGLVRLGGIDLVSLVDGRPIHQVPVPLWTPGGLDMTHNPMWIEPSSAGLRAYFMPEDDRSTIYVYDVE